MGQGYKSHSPLANDPDTIAEICFLVAQLYAGYKCLAQTCAATSVGLVYSPKRTKARTSCRIIGSLLVNCWNRTVHIQLRRFHTNHMHAWWNESCKYLAQRKKENLVLFPVGATIVEGNGPNQQPSQTQDELKSAQYHVPGISRRFRPGFKSYWW